MLKWDLAYICTVSAVYDGFILPNKLTHEKFSITSLKVQGNQIIKKTDSGILLMINMSKMKKC